MRVPIDPRVLEILVCPVSKARLLPSADGTELWCRASGLAYPVRDGIPVMLPEQARALRQVERDALDARQ